MLTPLDYLWVFTILLVLGEGCHCCVPCLELALLVTAFPHRLQWRTYRVPCSQMGCITLSKCVWDTGNQTCFWLLYPFPFSSRFGCIPDHIRFFFYSIIAWIAMVWKPIGVVQCDLFLTSLELLNSLTSWKLPSAPGVQMHFLPPPLASLHSASCAETDFSQPFLGLLCAIPSLSVIGCPWKVSMI